MMTATKPYIFFDLDGPILDVSEKYYQVYRHVLTELGFEPIDKDAYWTLKRKKEPVPNILGLSGAEHVLEQYRTKRNELIETKDFIRFDELQPDAQSILTELSENNTLILVTLRGSRTELMDELNNLDVLKHFETILSSGEKIDPRWKIKYNLINAHFDNKPPLPSWIIGDTETDILAGKNLGLNTIGVNSGIRSMERIQAVEPNHHIQDIRELRGILL
ncbi:MAG: HAD family hydrolase [Bacteroidia bacterium]|nr:HAD family hydrolase [Bacteroidia bacterium]